MPSPLATHDYLACDLSEWRGDPARCRWCDLPLYGRKLFCTLDCKAQAVENHAWPTAKARVRTRDRRCVRCGSPHRLEVHHKVPCGGTRTFSCLHHLPGLQLLCDLCHDEEHVAA